MENTAFFKTNVQHPLLVVNSRVRNILINLADTSTNLPSFSYEEIDYFVKTSYEVNSKITTNANILIPQNTILGLKSVIFGTKDQEICVSLPTLDILQNFGAL